MAFTGQIGAPNSMLGNIVLGYGARLGPVILYTTQGVDPTQVGDLYDIAMGFPDPVTGEVVMVGYVITNSGQWQESTNLQDEEHLVQISSPSSSDRFTRYPKVSQGDWSGGERQLIFTDATRYYSSRQVDALVPGHLRIWGNYASIPLSTAYSAATGRVVQTDAQHIYVLASNNVRVVAWPALTVTAVSFTGTPLDIVRSGDYIYIATSTGVWQVPPAGPAVQVTNDVVKLGPANSGVMGFFNGSLWYWGFNPGPGQWQLNSATYPFPGAAGGTTQYTLPKMYANVATLSDASGGLVFATASAYNSMAIVYSFDGVNATEIGKIEGGLVIDSVEANGVTYVLMAAPQANGTYQPVIYSVSGSTISVLDDYRSVDSAFQSTATASVLNGRLDSDGQFLYMFFTSLHAKAYRLSAPAVFDIGNPLVTVAISALTQNGAALMNGSIVELSAANNTQLWVDTYMGTPNVDGLLTTSWFDFGVPGIRKAFTSIEFVMNSAIDTSALSVAWQTDLSGSGFTPLQTAVVLSGDALICYLPLRTIGTRIRFQITLNHLAIQGPPDVELYAVSGKLARVWQLQVACRRQQTVRNGDRDPQNLTSRQLLANIRNAYDVAAGNVVLFVPDPTIDTAAVAAGLGPVVGVAEVTAVLQDYQWTTAPGVSPAYRQSPGEGISDMEGDVALVLAGTL